MEVIPMQVRILQTDYANDAGFHARMSRSVDTDAQADAIARNGLLLDEQDGGHTAYRLRVWEELADRAILLRERTWDESGTEETHYD